MWVHQSTVTRQADAYLVAVAGKMLVQQGLELHAFQLSAQEREVIDTFTNNGWHLGHAETLPQCSKPLKI